MPAVVDDQPDASAAAEQSVALARHFIHQRAVFPRRVTDEVVNALIVGAGHVFINALNILRPPLGLHEPLEVNSRRSDVVIRAGMEKFGKGLGEGHKTFSGPGYIS